MAKTLIRIVESVKEELGQYKLTDEFPVSDEYLIDKIHDVRSTLIHDLYKSGVIDTAFYTKYCCLDVECSEEGCVIDGIFIPSGWVIWHIDLPQMIVDVGELNILYLGLMGFNGKFTRLSLGAFLESEGLTAFSNVTIYTVVGNKVYLKNLPTTGTRKVCLIALLYDPTEACNYDADNTPYPVPSDVTLQLLVKKDILSTVPGFIPDNHQDGRYPDVTNTGQKQVQGNKE